VGADLPLPREASSVGTGRLPLVSMALCALACLLMLLPPAVHERLYFDHRLLRGGDVVGLVSGHWIHADGGHLAWNVAALSILAAVIERHSRRLLLHSLAVGTACVDLLLLSPLSAIQRYCGLSGLLNTLLGVALYLCWRETRSAMVPLMGAACLAKIALESLTGHSLFTDISWPPFPAAHLAGMAGAALVLACRRQPREGTLPITRT
jgi:rhomboid family GlyGly-CTERM serine protease